ncbi:hypothetical protein [Mycolicibacterium lutetiense]|uniref:Uncharacterized protein n=1 Tax=Mycolicibacterium lutetiense TaxID=1641992 RepID=A0ABS4ZPG8_9MYCO|nr:hypothetical protein [Mycolicibacterium lutetiense]MBP2451368.1 hypothetical protein [Mycolicibacterium lutetiense]
MLLRRTFALAQDARQRGSAPYGALRAITVIGPLLEDEAAQPHEGYWH